MRLYKFLPLILVAALAACGKGGGESAPANSAVPAENAAPAASNAAAPAAAPAAAQAADNTAAAPAAPAADNAAAAKPAADSSADAAKGSAGDLAKGEQVFQGTCQACHGTGVMGAPKFGDKAAWAPRIAQGKATLYQHALNGIRMMPAHGGNPSLSDSDVKAAVDYMVSKAS